MFLAKVAVGLLAAPRAAWTQQSRKIYRIGIPGTGINTRSAPFYVAFEQRLRELGWIDGRNVALQYKDRNPEELHEVVEEMVRDQMDVILVSGSDRALKAAMRATQSIPIVLVALNFDPLEKGYLASLAHPGGNVTGIFARNPEIGAKQLELVKQALPNATRVGVVWERLAADQLPAIEAAAARL